jgi:hypothetical protein
VLHEGGTDEANLNNRLIELSLGGLIEGTVTIKVLYEYFRKGREEKTG